jgi:RNA polymerase sigma-70 factor (ECF subfamily)
MLSVERRLRACEPGRDRASVSQTSDEILFERHRQGDPTAMRTLIERHQADLMRFLTRLTGETAGAEDVFQEAFLQAHVAAHTFDAERRFRPWLFTIAANKARDYLRRRVRRRTLDLSAPMDGGGSGGEGPSASFIDLMEVDIPAPDAAMQRRETSVKVQGILDALPYTLREILLLAYFQRLSYVQIADELGIPLGTVKSRLHSAVATFAKLWKAKADEAAARPSPE